MRARKNKYQRDKRGYIIDNTKEKEPSNGKGKAKVEAVTAKNKFNALEVEEIAPPTLRIPDGKRDNSNNEKHKKQQRDKYNKDQEKKQVNNKENSSSPKGTGNISAAKGGNPNPNDSRIRVEDHGKDNQEGTLHPKTIGTGIGMAARRVKKEAVEATNKENNVKPSQIGTQSPDVKGNKELAKASSPSSIEVGIDEGVNKESTIEWVHRRFGTSKEELRELNVTINQSCHEVPSQTYENSGQLEEHNEVNSRKTLWSDEADEMEAQIGSTNAT
ncbi:uncharacterized protein [Nicotiana tomentosiformis]|uniref:uncharacterized protein n=1 Tax=Nicotiana tomentosiformis TaxID=4098 RepID=UPI00388C94A5